MNEEDKLYENLEKEKKSFKFKCIIISIILILLAGVISSEYTMFRYNRSLFQKGEAELNAAENIDLIGKTLMNFRKVIDEVYLGEVDESKMLDQTLKGYVNGLDDEYSEYFTKEEWESFQSNALGNYVGIGIYMSMDKNNNVVVISPIKGTPAEAAGLKPGDIIAEVNGENVLGTSSEFVSNKVKGPAGTTVDLTLVRDNTEVKVNVERKEIKVYHVETEMLEGNIGYISLATFDEGCAEEFIKGYQALKAKGAKKIIVDLRNNTGGLVDQALEIADTMLEKDKTILVTVDSKGNKNYDKAKNDRMIKEDIVILVNEYSASASEILTGALKDNGVAKVVGTKTFGKGVIQDVFTLNDGSALKLTSREYYTPNETKIHKVGITPDVEIEMSIDSKEDIQLNKAIELLK